MMPNEMMPPPGGAPKGAAPMPPKDDAMGKGGSTIACPSCGAQLSLEPADEGMDAGAMGDMGSGQ